MPYSSLNAKKRSAAIRMSNDGFYLDDLKGHDYIYFNDALPYERINMTILHETGHCALDHKGKSETEEAEANFFAKYAAAPPPLVHRVHPQTPEHIARVFCLSLTAAKYAFNYYNKWLTYGENRFKRYEIRLLKLFSAA